MCKVHVTLLCRACLEETFGFSEPHPFPRPHKDGDDWRGFFLDSNEKAGGSLA